MADYDQAIKLNPNSSLAFNLRGVIRAADGDLVGAISDFSRMIELEPQIPDGYFLRGMARADHGDSVEAVADLRHYLELSPDVPYRSKIEEMISQLKAMTPTR